MSRELKRVPIDFGWPMNKIWTGYLLKNCIDNCEDCREFARIKGLPMTSYDCPSFEVFEPPIGDGWQMWESTSEGSPISPVFETPELLAKWLADTGASSFGASTATYDQWLLMITKHGWAISAVATPKGIVSGVEDYSSED